MLGQARNKQKPDKTALMSMKRPKYLMEESLNIFIQMDFDEETNHGVSWTYDRSDRTLLIHAIGCSCYTFPILVDLNIIPVLNEMLWYSATKDPYMNVENPNADKIYLFVNEDSDAW